MTSHEQRFSKDVSFFSLLYLDHIFVCAAVIQLLAYIFFQLVENESCFPSL